MPKPLSIPPLIPLPNDTNQRPNNLNDEKEDIFATLFSPATPRASPSTSPPSGESSMRPKLSRPRYSHSRTSSADSEFGSFVSVAEDPLTQFVSASDSVPFTPLQNYEFFEGAKDTQEKKKKGVLDELLQHEADPLYFLRDATPTATQPGSPIPGSPDGSGPSGSGTPLPELRSRASSNASQPVMEQPLIDIVSSPGRPPIKDRSTPDLLLPDPDDNDNGRPWRHPTRRMNRSEPPLMTPSPPPVPHPPARANPKPRSGVLHELLEHQDDPLYFHASNSGASTSASNSRTATPQLTSTPGEVSLLDFDTPEDESGWHARSRSLSRRPAHNNAPSRSLSPSTSTSPRSPSLPPTTPMKISLPEVQRAQSYFMPSSFAASSAFPTRWVSSLLSRPAPRAVTPPPHPPAEAESSVPITHGTPFAAHTYVPPSGAPGFAGDRAWDKGFEFDKENVERTSVRLVGRRETTTPVLTVALADKLRAYLPALKRLTRSWTLLYSLDQHGISLNTLYTRCEAQTGSALLIMKDSNDALFGAWMGEGIRPSKGAYYGSGESFLWKMLPDDQLRVYKWSGKNDYVALCEPEYLSFGGGDGHYGLYLDETLSDGSSAHCPTFNNEPLCSPGPRQGDSITFECVALEVWGVG